jgi:hypothetical protein
MIKHNDRIHREEIIDIKITSDKTSYSRKIFSNNNDFFQHIRDLKKMELIHNDGNGCYCFTREGWYLANILGVYDEKYKKYAKEISCLWIP